MSRKKIRVIHLVSDLGIGGAQKVVLDIASSANLERFDLSIYSLGRPSDLLAAYELDPRIEIRTFSHEFENDFSFWAYLKRALVPSAYLRQFETIINAAIKARPDILHVHLGPRELNLGLLIQKKTGCKIVFTQHLSALSKRSVGITLLGLILRLTYRKYNLIAVSKTIEAEIRSHGLIARNRKLFLIENKLSLNKFVPTQKSKKDRIYVVYVARIGPPKAHNDLIRAWSLLSDDLMTKRLVLVGPDSMNNEMQMLAKNLGVADTIEFTGPIHRVTEILDQADIAVFPSHSEGLPVALLEKMAMRLPVVVSDIPGLTTVVTDNVNGLTFRCGDVKDLADKIETLVQDPCLRDRLGEKARETVEQRFGSVNVAYPNELVYEELISGESS